jgi:H+/gluconate symporter-like permease
MTGIAVSAIGMVLAIAAFMFLVFKGVPHILSALSAVIIVCIVSQNGFLNALVDTFQGAAAKTIASMTLLILSGSILGGVMSATGCSESLGNHFVKWLGVKNAPWIIMIVTFLTVLGGNGQYVFVVVAVSISVMAAANMPMYIAMVAMSGAGIMTSFMLPGFPGITNIIPTMFLHTDVYAGSLIGIVCFVVGIVLHIFYILKLMKQAERGGIGYTAPSNIMPQEDTKTLPSFGVALLPVLLVVLLVFLFQKTTLKWDANRSAIVAQAIAILVMYIMNWKRLPKKLAPLATSIEKSLPFLVGLACIQGLAGVLGTTSAYQAVLHFVTTIHLNPYVTTVLAVAIIAAITTDGLGCMIVFFQTVAPSIIALPGVNLGVIHRLTTMTATTVDSLPHNGSIYMTLQLFGYSHKSGYKYLFISSVLIPSICAAIGTVMGVLFY